MPRFNWLTLFVVLALFGAAWLPRTLALDRFVTADERLWLARSANFYLALAERNAADTFQREHPGVTVMWAGALGFLNEFPTYPQVTPGPFDWESEALESWLYSATTHTPLELLAAGRWWIALAIALAITAGYFPLHRLLGGAAALVATLFVAWDPFFIALSRELHPDGLVAALMLLALLYWLAWLYAGQRWRDLVAAGILMGLAWLTKTPAIFLVLTGAILVAIELLRRKDSIATPPIVGLLGWGLVATLTFVALWPAMWVDPLGTLAEMAREMSSYLEGHVNPNFFWGATTADPGPWFYPVSYWFRTTPAVLIGLLATAIVFWPRVAPFDRRSARQTALALVLFALIFTIGMTLGSKKFDRYLLPIFPALSILAAVGWLSISQWIIGFWTHWRTSSPHPLILALPVLAVLLLHGLLGFSHYPYYLTYYNPLAGGGAVAQRVIMVGWGEGMDQAAAWLNQQPDGATARVVAWYGDGPLSYFLRSREPVFSFWSPEYWLAADYAVVYLSQRQRLIPDRAVIDYFAGLPAAHVVVVDGLELARIYDLRGRPPPDFVGLATDSAGALGCCLRLAGYAVGQHNFLSGDQVIVRLFLDGDDALATGAVSTLHLFAPDGGEVAQSSLPLGPEQRSNNLYVLDHKISVPADAPTGQYTVTLTVEEHDQRPVERVVTSFEINAANTVDVDVDWGNVRLTKVQVPEEVETNDALMVALVATGQVDGSLKLSARLVDESGWVLSQADDQLTAVTTVELPIPADTTTGVYTLTVVVYDPVTLNPFLDTKEQFATPLTAVQVIHPDG